MSRRYNYLLNFGLPAFLQGRWCQPNGSSEKDIDLVHLCDFKWKEPKFTWAQTIAYSEIAKRVFVMFQTYYDDRSRQYCDEAQHIIHIDSNECEGDDGLADFRVLLEVARRENLPEFIGFTGYRHRQKFIVSNGLAPDQTTPKVAVAAMARGHVACWYAEESWRYSADRYHGYMADVILEWLPSILPETLRQEFLKWPKIAVPMASSFICRRDDLLNIATWVKSFLAWAGYRWHYPSTDYCPVFVEDYTRYWPFFLERIIALYYTCQYGQDLRVVRLLS